MNLRLILTAVQTFKATQEKYREEFYPTLFCPTKNPTKFRTLDGKVIDKIQPGTISECRNEVRKWKNSYNINLYGSTDWVCQYIGKEFDQCKYDLSKVRKSKKVKPFYISLLPKDISLICLLYTSPSPRDRG